MKHPFIWIIIHYVGMILAFIPYKIYLKRTMYERFPERQDLYKALATKTDSKKENDKLIVRRVRLLDIGEFYKYLVILVAMKFFINHTTYITSNYDQPVVLLDFSFLSLIITSYLCTQKLKYPLEKHQKLSMIIAAFSLFLLLVFEIIFVGVLNIDNFKPIYILFIIISIFWQFVNSYDIYLDKYIMDIKTINSYHLIFLVGLLGFSSNLILFIIVNFIGIKNKVSFLKFNVDNKYYYDNFIYYINEIVDMESGLDIFLEIIFIILEIIRAFIYNSIIYNSIKFLSPIHFLITICFNDIIKSLHSIFGKFETEYNLREKQLKLYNHGKIVSNIILFIILLIYTEIIELKFCGLNINIKKNIILREILEDKKPEESEVTSVNDSLFSDYDENNNSNKEKIENKNKKSENNENNKNVDNNEKNQENQEFDERLLSRFSL